MKLNQATFFTLELAARKYLSFAHPAIFQKGTGEMIDGFHRTAVVDKLALEGIEVLLDKKEIETDDPKAMAIEINSNRRPWDDVEERRTQAQFLRTQTDKEGNFISVRSIADALGAGQSTIRRDLAKPAGATGVSPAASTAVPCKTKDLSKTPTAPSGAVGVSTSVPSEPVEVKPSKTKGKDGKARAAVASIEEINKAWAMKDSGMSVRSIAKDLHKGESTVFLWFKKERPEAVTPAPAPAPVAAPVVAPAPAKAISETSDFAFSDPEEAIEIYRRRKREEPDSVVIPDPIVGKGFSGINERIMQRERKEIKARTELLLQFIELNKAMESMRKFSLKELKDHGCSIIRKGMKESNEIMVIDGLFSSACEVLGLSREASYEEMLRGIEVKAMELATIIRHIIRNYGFDGPDSPASRYEACRHNEHLKKLETSLEEEAARQEM